MATFYLSRHGETEYNVQNKLQGWFDTPLTKNGIKEAHLVGRKLRGVPFNAIYSSDLGRAFVTAYIISRDIGYTGEIYRAPELREVSFGDLSGQPLSKVSQMYHRLRNVTGYVPAHGEALAAMQSRVLGFLAKLAAQATTDPILIVTHDCVLNALYADFKNIDFGPYNIDHTNPYDQIFRMELDRYGNIEAFDHWPRLKAQAE